MLPFKNYNTINTNRIKTFSITTTVKIKINQINHIHQQAMEKEEEKSMLET